ncbi:hypothetical protein O181_062307 [Austropuccinia psidii MF-1]|uniref:Peroxisomal-coenzyme A synthetase n=1 Tax=Austropuccinia psidii MF-1 TaxID=1389203 RepID=A0A9Q3EME3_9BASI|nr:hypothetical protein [Austropuccinia psidii MF-1]
MNSIDSNHLTLSNFIHQSQSKKSKAVVLLPPSAIASLDSDQTHSISANQLFKLANDLASTFIKIRRPQMTISISLSNSIEFLTCFLAISQSALIAAPLNPLYTQNEANFYLSDSNSSLLLVHKGALDPNKPPPGAILAAKKLGIPIAEVSYQPHPQSIALNFNINQIAHQFISRAPTKDDIVLLLHTSGTTGKPKAVPLTHQNMIATIRNIQATYALSPKDRSFIIMPLFHVHGLLAGLFAPLGSGGSCVIPPRFSARTFWNEFILTKSNWYTAVPTIHQILLQTPTPSPLPTIRFIRSCSSALSPATHDQLERAFQAPVLEAYAMTEATHQMTSNTLPPAQRKPGTVGKPVGVELKILDYTSENEVEEGEVCIRGPNVTAGYLNNLTANQSSFTGPGGYFRTGDRGKFDQDGYLILTGRIKELINRGGEKISPIEIDSALLSIDGIVEAVTFGVPHAKYGEIPWAAVVLGGPSANQISEAIIQKELAKLLGQFKIPEKILIVDRIPKTATGKVLILFKNRRKEGKFLRYLFRIKN